MVHEKYLYESTYLSNPVTIVQINSKICNLHNILNKNRYVDALIRFLNLYIYILGQTRPKTSFEYACVMFLTVKKSPLLLSKFVLTSHPVTIV
jgi:hypothetical protein